MKISHLTIVAICLQLFPACNQDRITPDKITVIDDIVLGKDKQTFFKQIDSLKISNRVFYNTFYFDKYEDLSNTWYQFTSYYTIRFNHTPHNQISYNECIGLLCPCNLSGTENITELRVLLCNTQSPMISLQYLPEKYVSKNQNVNEEIIGEIVQMYLIKYGKPTIIDSNYNCFYVVEKGNYNPYHDDKRKGILYVWENKYLTIKLFTGLKSYDCTYDTKNKGYDVVLWHNPTDSVKIQIPGIGEMQCFSFPFIDYELTDTAIKEMNLYKMKI